MSMPRLTALPTWWSAVIPDGPYLDRLDPLALVALEGLAVVQNRLLALDRQRGYLLELDPHTQVPKVVNPSLSLELLDTYAVASDEQGGVWFVKGTAVYRIPWAQVPYAKALEEYLVLTAPYALESVAISPTVIYASCYQRDKILLLDPVTGERREEWPAPGIGREQLFVQGDYLWVSDRVEETIYVLNRHTGKVLAAFLTPHPHPTGLTIWKQQLLVAYAIQDPYIQDNPNAPDPLSVALRDRTFVEPLRIKPPLPQWIQNPEPGPLPPSPALGCPLHFFPQVNRDRALFTLSNGHLVEMLYMEELAPHDPVLLPHLSWRIALPCNSLRQVVRSVSPIGIPFNIEQDQGQNIAVYNLGTIQPNESALFGWRVILELYNIKYHLTPDDVDDVKIPNDLATRYLIDDDDLAMDTPIVMEAARRAIGTETNLLRKMTKIREFVYDKLSYRVVSRISTPDVVLERGEGSCGEYVGLLLALARLNGIPCRTVGRYKCPRFSELRNTPLLPQYNHVWLEFYVPGWGWLPMESNPDDLGDSPYPQRYFMGLPWTHAEIAKGISFESCSSNDFSLGELAINHVQFKILQDL